MHENGGKTGKDGLIVLTALLTLWFCVIIMGRNDDMTVSGETSAGVLIIDAGHGGRDTGAVSPHGKPEKDANLRLAKGVAEKLREKGFVVKMTREDDSFPALYDRPKVAHGANADAFVSIHHNAPGYESDPTQIRYQSVYAWNAIGEDLAGAIAARLAAARPDLPSKGVLHANFAVTRNPEIPSCLVEADFVTHPEGERAAWDEAECERAAAAIADGIADWAAATKESLSQQSKTAKAEK